MVANDWVGCADCDFKGFFEETEINRQTGQVIETLQEPCSGCYVWPGQDKPISHCDNDREVMSCECGQSTVKEDIFTRIY